MLRKAVETVTPGECICVQLFVSCLLRDATLPTVLLSGAETSTNQGYLTPPHTHTHWH